MARKINKNDNRYLAKLVTGERAPCAFCLREVDDEITYGKLYAIGDIQCHYFCCLLSCCLIQKGHDEEGLFGFMYNDILAEIERCKKHKCSYCGRIGANLGCSVGVCRKQFHVPCGRDRNAVSLYYGSYKSFCQQHAPKQKISDHIMANARLRMKGNRIKGKHITTTDMKLTSESESVEEMVCVICYEPVDGFPTVNTFWPPCCGKDAWFHRTCLQRMALSAGMHYLKCPLCNDKESFYDAVVEQGYYVPDRDAAWELEHNAFAEIYERPATCSAEPCLCPLGRSHDAENGQWDIKLCLLCGSAGAHAQCIHQLQPTKRETPCLDQSEKSKANMPLDQSETREENNLTNKPNENILSLIQSNLSSDHLNTSPNNSNSSDKSNTLPDNSNTSDNLNKFPDNSNTFPDNSITPFDKSMTSDKSNTFSDNSNTLPDKSNTSPDKSNTLADNSIMPLIFVCRSCLPAAPEDLETLASSIEAIIQLEQVQSSAETRRPVMSSRMSIRRTKGRRAIVDRPSTSRSICMIDTDKQVIESTNVTSSRLDLNLKTPQRPHVNSALTLKGWTVDSKLLSPLKLLEQSFTEKLVCTGVRDAVLDEKVVETLRRKFRKPRPMCEKKRIVNAILDGVFDDLMKDSKQKEQNFKWTSPKKSYSSIESKELHSALDQSSKELEENQNKENDTNTANTPLKDTKNNMVEDVTSNLNNMYCNIVNTESEYQTNNENMESVNISFVDKYVNIKNNLAHLDNSDGNINNVDLKQIGTITEVTPEKNTKEQANLSENAIGYQCNNVIEEIPRETGENVCCNEMDSNCIKNCFEYNKKSEIEDTPAINACDNTIKTNHSSKTRINELLLSDENNKSSILIETANKIENISTNCSKDNERNLNQLISVSIVTKITENSDKECNKKDETRDTLENKSQYPEREKVSDEKDKISKKSLSLKKKLCKKHNRKSQKSVQKPKHCDTNNLFNKKQKVRSKSESSTDINIFKRLLTEKDLCSQLLLELTTGKVDDKSSADNSNNSKSQKMINDDQNISNENLKHNDTSKPSIKEKNLGKAPKNLKTTTESNKKPKSKDLPNPKDLKHKSSSPKNKKTDSNETPKVSNKNKSEAITKDFDESNGSLIKLDDTNSVIDTPKHKTIEMRQNSSLEISENNQHINIDVIKIEDSPTTNDSYKNFVVKLPDQLKTCFKFSPIEDTLDKNDIGIDLESFKKEYLNEVDREFMCSFKHKHVGKALDERQFRSPIDFAIDAAIKKKLDGQRDRKRKLSESEVKLLFDNNVVKKRKMSESDLKLVYDYDDIVPKNSETSVENNNENMKTHKDKNGETKEGKRKKDKSKESKRKIYETKEKRKEKRNKRKSSVNKDIEVTIDSSEKRSVKKKEIKTKFAIRNDNIKVKIRWRKEQFSLDIESQKHTKIEKKVKDSSKFKQYVLQFPEGSSKEVLVKPDKEVCPLKRKYNRNEKSSDKLRQMSIQSFFKLKYEK